MDPYTPITTSAKLSLPLNGTVYTTTRKVSAEKNLPEVGSTMGEILGRKFVASVVIESNESPVSNGLKTQTMTHAIIPSVADQLATNWEWSNANIGGQKFDSVSRTFIYPAADFDRTTPVAATAMPFETDSVFDGEGYILVSRSASRAGMQLEPAFKVEVRQYVRRVTMVNVGVDQLNGKPLFESSMLYHATETIPVAGITAAALFADRSNAWWGIQDDGFENSGGMISSQWYSVTSSQVVAGELTAAVTDPVSVPAFVTVAASIPSNEDFLWPAVLQFVEFMDWDRRDGGVDIFPRIVLKRERYEGPCHTTTTMTWSKTPFVIDPVTPMLPNVIRYGAPYFSLNVPPCLHGQSVSRCDIGSTDPTYTRNTGSARVTLATNFEDWPPSLVAFDDQKPHRGGYLRTRMVVLPPVGDGVITGGAPAVSVAAPVMAAASAISSSGATLSWSAVTDATDYVLEVALNSGFGTYQEYRVGSSGVVTGLAAATSYWARVSALRGPFQSVPSNVVTFTTSP